MWISVNCKRHQLNGQAITDVGSPPRLLGLDGSEPPYQSRGRDQIVARQAHYDRRKNAYPLSLAFCIYDSCSLPLLHIGVEGPRGTHSLLVAAFIQALWAALHGPHATVSSATELHRL